MKPIHVYLIAAARKVWYWSKHRRDAITAASIGPDLIQCNECRKRFPKNVSRGAKKGYAVDHIDPVVPADKAFPQIPTKPGCMSWDDYYDRLMFGKLQVLCLQCHTKKTRGEQNERRKRQQKLPVLRTRLRGRKTLCVRHSTRKKQRNRSRV